MRDVDAPIVAVYWNSRWGHLGRRNIYVRAVGDGQYEIQARDGVDLDEDSRWWVVPDWDVAMTLVADLMSDDMDMWRDLTALYVASAEPGVSRPTPG